MSRSFRKALLILLFSFIGLVCVVVLALGGGYLFIRSDSGSHRLLDFAKSKAETLGDLVITYDQATLDVFSGVSFTNLHVVSKSQPKQLDFTASDLHLKYSFALLARMVRLEDLTLKSANLVYHPVASAQQKKTEPEPTSSPNKLEQLIQKPPVRVEIDKVVLSHVAIDLLMPLAAGSFAFKTGDLSMTLMAHMRANDLAAKGQASLAVGSSFSFESAGSKAQSNMAMQAGWDIAIQQNKSWQYNFDIPSLVVDLNKTKTQSGKQTGLFIPKTNLDLKAKMALQSARLFDFDPESVREWLIQGQVTMEGFVYGTGPKAMSLPSQKITLKSALGEKVGLDLDYSAPRATLPSLFTSTTDLNLKAVSQIDRDLKTIQTDLGFSAAGEQLLAYKGLIKRDQSHTRLDGNLKTSLNEKTYSRVVALASAKGKGQIDLDGRFNLDVNTPAATDISLISDFNFVNSNYGSWNVKPDLKVKRNIADSSNSVDLVTQVTQAKRSATLPVYLASPVQLKVHAQIGKETQSTRFTATLPSVELTAANLRLHDISVEASASKTGNAFRFDQVEIHANKNDLVLRASGTADPDSKSALLRGRLDAELTPELSTLINQKLHGTVGLPFEVTVLRGREMNLTGAIETRDVQLSKGDISLSGITGRIPFSESLLWDGTSVRFANVNEQNPFERVDFERVRPLTDTADRLSIQKIGWVEKTYGPLVGFFSIQQNMIFAHQFEADLGAGRTYGEMFINMFPKHLQFGLLARISNLDLGEFLPKKFLEKIGGGEKKLSARSGFVVDLRKNSVDGRVDITDIGGPQLIALINVLDPTYENEKMNQVRNLLQYGYPTGVGLEFNEGYLNMEIALEALGLSHTQLVRGISVSNLLTPISNSIKAQLQKGPLR